MSIHFEDMRGVCVGDEKITFAQVTEVRKYFFGLVKYKRPITVYKCPGEYWWRMDVLGKKDNWVPGYDVERLYANWVNENQMLEKLLDSEGSAKPKKEEVS
jgi:hypothetical protein